MEVNWDDFEFFYTSIQFADSIIIIISVYCIADADFTIFRHFKELVCQVQPF